MIGVNTRTTNRSAQVARSIQRGKRQLLTDFGANVAGIAKQSMKRVSSESDQVSPPGRPPLIHSAEPNLTTIRSVVARDLSSVKSGPIKSSVSSVLGDPVPGIVERGGVVTKRVRRGRTTNVVRYVIRKRPYIRPAAMKAINLMRVDVARKGIAR